VGTGMSILTWQDDVVISDLRERLFQSHMGSRSGATNSSGVRLGGGAKNLLGVDLGADYFLCYINLVYQHNSFAHEPIGN
jgi:hypothetical protein